MSHRTTIKRAEAQVRSTLEKLRARTTAHQAELEKIRASGMYSAEHSRELITKERERFADELASLKTSHDEAIQTVRSLPMTISSEVAGTGTATDGAEGRLLAELETSRAWDRVGRQLDSANGELGALQQSVLELASEGDAATMRSLSQELPSYLKSSGIDQDFADALASLAADKLMGRHPEGETVQAAQKASEGWTALGAHNFSYAERLSAGEEHVPDFNDIPAGFGDDAA